MFLCTLKDIEMACVTLKRPSNWENLNQYPLKRRRFNPFDEAPVQMVRDSAPPTTMENLNQGPGFPTMKRTNPFADLDLPSFTDRISENILFEMRHINKRRRLTMPNESAQDLMAATDMEPSIVLAGVGDIDLSADSPRPSPSPSGSDSQKSETPVFTVSEVQRICERMLKEHKELLCEQYNSILSSKLSEQYDTFVKFTYDQIQKDYCSVPTYLS